MQLIIFLVVGILLLEAIGGLAGIVFEATGPVGCLVAGLLVLCVGVAMFH